MSPRVSLSLKAAQRLVSEHLQGGCCSTCDAPVAELRAAIAKAVRSSATRRKLAKPKAEKRAAKREKTSALRATVQRRAGVSCEACDLPFTDFQPAELDHFWGRAREESVTACWMLCRCCHRQKTDNRPDRGYWLTRFGEHCLKHGYSNEAAKARREGAWVESKAVSR